MGKKELPAGSDLASHLDLDRNLLSSSLKIVLKSLEPNADENNAVASRSRIPDSVTRYPTYTFAKKAWPREAVGI